MNDVPSEERIEEMLEAERELAAQYEEHLIGDSETPDEDERPVDRRLNEYTGRIIDYELRETNKKYLRFRILCHDGSTTFAAVDIPEDLTDETEELVRLCSYLDVPIDRLGDLQGKYVPIVPDSRDNVDDSLEIPPIPTTGNQLVSGLKRSVRTRPLVRTGVQWGKIAVLRFSWIPLLTVALLTATESPAGNPVLVLDIIAAILLAVAAFSFVASILMYHGWAVGLKRRFFP